MKVYQWDIKERTRSFESDMSAKQIKDTFYKPERGDVLSNAIHVIPGVRCPGIAYGPCHEHGIAWATT